MFLFFRLYNKKRIYDPIDYAYIDETNFWIVDENQTTKLDVEELENLLYVKGIGVSLNVYIPKKMNRLKHQRLNDLVYVHYNLWLKNWYKCFLSCFEFKFAFTIMNNYMFFFFRFYNKKKKPMIPLTMHALMRLIFG